MNVTENVGATATLKCAAVSGSSLKFHWFKWIEENSTFVVVGFPRLQSVEKHKYEGNLELLNVSVRDAGKYRCQVRNGGGSEAKIMYLKVLQPTTSTSGKFYSGYTVEARSVSCHAAVKKLFF